MDKVAVDRALQAFFADVQCIFTSALAQVRTATGSKSAHEANSKFDGFEGNFASLKDFHAGAEATLQLGYPNPAIERGIFYEHTHSISVTRLFVTPNYRLATCLLIEYWWAVDPSRKEGLDLVVRLRKAREIEDDTQEECGRLAAPASDCDYDLDSPLALYPGEVGDRFCETTVVFILSAASGTATASSAQLAAAKLTDTKLTARLKEPCVALATGAREHRQSAVLASDEECVRGAQVLPQHACLEWKAQSTHVLAPLAKTLEDETKGLEKVHTDAGTAVVGVVLPMSRTRATTRLAGVRAAVAEIVGLPDSGVNGKTSGSSAGVRVLWVSGRITTYCKVPSVAELRKRLEEQSNADLRSTARNRMGVFAVDIDQMPRADVVAAVVNAFVRVELQSDLAAALRSGFKSMDEALLDTALDALFRDWPSPAPMASREERIAAAAAGLDSVARWEAVAVWVGLFWFRMQGRTREGISYLMRPENSKIGQYLLKQGEVLALYLYTGPEFVPMNGILRNFPQNIIEMLNGNTMCTTLFCISSALKKIGRGTELPSNGKVFRGLGKMLLPSQFWVPHDTPAWRGGVERAFMSTTADKSVALFYAKGRGTVVEIRVGRIQIGGDITFLSMVHPLPRSFLRCSRSCT
jgi:hypothetical protein